jgi:hypothetical protein
MTSPARRLLDRELTSIIERLAVEFPDAPLGTVARAVESAAPPARRFDIRVLPATVAAIEATARASLVPLTASAA